MRVSADASSDAAITREDVRREWIMRNTQYEGFELFGDAEYFEHIGDKRVVTDENHELVVPIMSIDPPVNNTVFMIEEQAAHVVYNVTFAQTYFARLRGLMGKKVIPKGLTLVFPSCKSVHCMFMRSAIDIVYLDADLRVLGCETVKPWKRTHAPRGTKHVAEMAAGTAEKWGIHEGDQMTFCEKSREELLGKPDTHGTMRA